MALSMARTHKPIHLLALCVPRAIPIGPARIALTTVLTLPIQASSMVGAVFGTHTLVTFVPIPLGLTVALAVIAHPIAAAPSKTTSHGTIRTREARITITRVVLLASAMTGALVLTHPLIAGLPCEAEKAITFTLLAPTIVMAVVGASTHLTTLTLPALVTVANPINTNAMPGTAGIWVGPYQRVA